MHLKKNIYIFFSVTFHTQWKNISTELSLNISIIYSFINQIALVIQGK